MIPLHRPISKLDVKTTDIIYAVKQWMGLAFVKRQSQPVEAYIAVNEEAKSPLMDTGARFMLTLGLDMKDGATQPAFRVSPSTNTELCHNVTQGNVNFMGTLLEKTINATAEDDTYTEYRRWNPEEFFRTVEGVDQVVYHSNDFDTVCNDEYDGNAVRRLKGEGKMDIWTVRSGVHGYVFILTHPDDTHEEPDSRWQWRAFSYLTSDKGLPDTISYMGEGWWGTMRTLMITFLEVYEHEDGHEMVAELLSALKSITVLRRNIYHPLGDLL